MASSTENQKKLMDKLAEMFQFDQADLDFGIYRIMNYKRDEIKRFLEEDLMFPDFSPTCGACPEQQQCRAGEDRKGYKKRSGHGPGRGH
jgi:hypothetical protein